MVKNRLRAIRAETIAPAPREESTTPAQLMTLQWRGSSWAPHTTNERAQQYLHSHGQLKEILHESLYPQDILQAILMCCTTWYGKCSSLVPESYRGG